MVDIYVTKTHHTEITNISGVALSHNGIGILASNTNIVSPSTLYTGYI